MPVYGRKQPEGWPDGHGTAVCSPSLKGKEVGAVIEVVVDHDAGSLSFRINRGPLLPALGGYPRGARLRPWARLCHEGDRLSFE